MQMPRHALMAACAAVFAAVPAAAQDLKIGVASEISSFDPHFHNRVTNNWMSRHVFEGLTMTDALQRLKPALATSWRAVGDNTWELTLRRDVRFHDGTPFTADDVLFSIARAPAVPNSPGSFGPYTKTIKAIEAPEPFLVRITTAQPDPLIPLGLSKVAIMSKAAATGKTTDQLNQGQGTIGTGPYKFVRWVPGQQLQLARNDAYWGEREPWATVTFRPMTNPTTRVAALLAGDIDLIDAVPPASLATLRQNRDVTLFQSGGTALIFLHLDTDRAANSPFATTPTGANPLKDPRVRKAMSLAIDRKAIVERTMDGAAVPAGQLVAAGSFGYNPKLEVDAYDLAAAKRLLAEAGYPDGFGLTLHGPNDRYVNDRNIAQAVAQMLSRAGIETKVDTAPASVFFARGSKLEFSFMLLGWGNELGIAADPLRGLLATYDPDKGLGAFNRGRYSNPALDAMLRQALVTVDDARRDALEQQASEIAMRDYGLIPLHFQTSVWATRKGFTYEPRGDEGTLAMSLRKTN